MKVLLHGWQKNHYVYDGLIENLGAGNIFSYLPLIFNRNYGDTADSFNSEDFTDNLDSFDLIIFTPRSFYDTNFKHLLEHKTSTPKVFLDLEDDFFIRNIYKHEEIDLYFKRELYTSLQFLSTAKWYVRYMYGSQILPPVHRRIGIPQDLINSFPYKVAISDNGQSKLRPFPLTVRIEYPLTTLKEHSAENDLFFCLTLSTVPDRHRYYRAIKKWSMDGNTFKKFISSGGVPKDRYVELLSGSKAAISVRGMGYDTDRYWEIPRFGSTLFSQKIPIFIENDFVDGESAVFFNNLAELKNKFYKYVLKSNEWREIAGAGFKHFVAYHTPKMRIQNSLLNKLNEI